jgi:hypothetical protein
LPQQRLFDFLVEQLDSLRHDREFAGLLQREILERDVKGIRNTHAGRLQNAIRGGRKTLPGTGLSG